MLLFTRAALAGLLWPVLDGAVQWGDCEAPCHLVQRPRLDPGDHGQGRINHKVQNGWLQEEVGHNLHGQIWCPQALREEERIEGVAEAWLHYTVALPRLAVTASWHGMLTLAAHPCACVQGLHERIWRFLGCAPCEDDDGLLAAIESIQQLCHVKKCYLNLETCFRCPSKPQAIATCAPTASPTTKSSCRTACATPASRALETCGRM